MAETPVQRSVMETALVRFTFWWLNILGLWPTSRSTSRYNLMGYTFHFFCTFLYVFLMALDVATKFGIDDLYMFLTEICMAVKVAAIIVYRHQIRAHMERVLHAPGLQVRTEKEAEVVTAILRNFSWKAWLYYAVSIVTATSLALAGLLLQKGTDFQHPIFVPWSLGDARGLAFYLIYLYQSVFLMMHATLNVLYDTFHAYIVVHLQCQLRLMVMRFRNSEATTCLKSAYNHYNEIYVMANAVQDMISIPAAVQLNMSAVIICVTTYLLSIASFRDSAQFHFIVGLINFIVALVVQIFVFTNYPHNVTYECELLYTASYEQNWLNLTVAERRELIVFRERLKKSMHFRAVHFIPLNIGTFFGVRHKRSLTSE